jgi:radical SAM protein with 4Fe4S-binding SPASM domain
MEYSPSMQVSIQDRQRYYRALIAEQMRLLEDIIERYYQSGCKISEQYLNLSLSKLIKGIAVNNACYRTPFCGSLDDIVVINSNGSLSSCPGLRGKINPQLNILAKKRMNWCVGCPVSSLCMGGCFASFLSVSPQENSIERLHKDFAVLCDYHRSMLENLFFFVRGKLDWVLKYYCAH